MVMASERMLGKARNRRKSEWSMYNQQHYNRTSGEHIMLKYEMNVNYLKVIPTFNYFKCFLLVLRFIRIIFCI